MHDTKFSCARCDPGEALSCARIGLETSKASTAQESCAQECLENRFLRATVVSIAETLPSLQNQGSTGCQNSCAFLRVLARIFAFLAQIFAFPTRSCADVFGQPLLFWGLLPFRVHTVLAASSIIKQYTFCIPWKHMSYIMDIYIDMFVILFNTCACICIYIYTYTQTCM